MESLVSSNLASPEVGSLFIIYFNFVIFAIFAYFLISK